jgi:2'-5' RNA ligase
VTDPIILTLLFGKASEERFEKERRRWFVPRLNKVPAHLTLFHKLLGDEADTVIGEAQQIASTTKPFAARVSGPFLLGQGIALRLESEEIGSVRGALAEAFASWLTAQDQAGFRPHVTVQNKVTQDTAKACLQVLSAEFEPFEADVLGLRLWHYRGGPWEALREVRFGETS